MHFLSIRSAAAWLWRTLETAMPQCYQLLNGGYSNVYLMPLLWVQNGSVPTDAWKHFGTEANRSSVLPTITSPSQTGCSHPCMIQVAEHMLPWVFVWILHGGAQRPALIMQFIVVRTGLERASDKTVCRNCQAGTPSLCTELQLHEPESLSSAYLSPPDGTIWVLSIQAFIWRCLVWGSDWGETVKEVINQPPALTSC